MTTAWAKHRECKYPGVGRIWKEGDMWYWETKSGRAGGPTKSRECAMHSMDTNWRTEMRDRAGLSQHSSGARYQMPDEERLDPRSSRYDADLITTWQQARMLICRRWRNG